MHVQIGSWLVHNPLLWHILVCSPFKVHPSSQVYDVIEPGEVPVTFTWPLSGFIGQPHTRVMEKREKKGKGRVGGTVGSV